LSAEAVTVAERLQRRGLPPRQNPPEPPLTVSEEPFFRPQGHARVRPGRRGRARRLTLLLQVGAVFLLSLAALRAGYGRVLASEHLNVLRVEVRGNQLLSEGEVRELLGPAVGENILSLDLEALTKRLKTSPWVASTSVRRRLPDTLVVEIVERVPLALAEVDRLYLMDGEGTLIDIFGPRTAQFDLPIVRGLQDMDAETRRSLAERAGVLLVDLGPLARELSEVQPQAGNLMRVVLRTGEVLLLGEPPYRQRVQTFLGLRQALVERSPQAEHFDLRFRNRIYARVGLPGPPPAAGAAEGGAQ
jgi:cell division protein FtsQ